MDKTTISEVELYPVYLLQEDNEWGDYLIEVSQEVRQEYERIKKEWDEMQKKLRAFYVAIEMSK